jgi:hypothetical protein
MNWISINDILPGNSREVLCHLLTTNGMPENLIMIGFRKDNKWFFRCYYMFTSDECLTEEDEVSIIHWMELPSCPGF